jgi:DNA-binding CsgD family transcriptional regulator
MKRPRGRVSVTKEDRIWQLRCQGYDYDSIARIVNISPNLTPILRRVRRRPPLNSDPIRRGRKAGFLSDNQIADIKNRCARGERQKSVGESYGISESAVSRILNGITYSRPEYETSGYPYSFANRLTSAC